MKSIFKITLLAILATFITSYFATAQVKSKGVETIEIKVAGVCKMCQKRIEKAALIKGVKYAKWDKNVQHLTVVYRPSKVDEMAIHESVAKKGHDTDKVKAPDDEYRKLPKCCRYRDGVKVH